MENLGHKLGVVNKKGFVEEFKGQSISGNERKQLRAQSMISKEKRPAKIQPTL
jgi:hypothetical protein